MVSSIRIGFWFDFCRNIRGDVLPDMEVLDIEVIETFDSRRARSKVISREKIVLAAAEMFSKLGFEAASLRDIAKQAGLTTGAVFANFSDKLELFKTVFEAEQERVFALVYAAFDDGLDTSACLLKKIKIGYEAVEGRQRLFMSAFVLNWTKSQSEEGFVGVGFRIRDLCRFVLNRGVERGELRASADIETAALVLEELLLASLRFAYYQNLSADDVVAHLKPQMAIVINGMAKEMTEQA